MSYPLEIKVGDAVLTGIDDGDGLPVVFLHAGVCDHRMWLNQVDAVARAGYRGIAYDRRGFGGASSPDEPFRHLDDLTAVLDNLELDAAVLVGCSMGGGLAIDFALALPDRVLGLVPVGTAITGADAVFSANDEEVEMRLWEIEKRGSIEEQLPADAWAWLDGPRSAEGRVGGALRELFLDMDRTALTKGRELVKQTRPPSAKDRVGEITEPALLVVGDLDFNYIIDRHEQLSEDLPNAFGVILENTAHLPNFERPDLFNPLLLEFLASVRE